MIKKLSLIAMAAMTMASCSNDEDVTVNNGKAIDFRASMGSRATETTTDNLNSIHVTALDGENLFFENVEFSKEGTSFSSATKYYWPANDNELTFYAYSPAANGLGGTLATDKDGLKVTDFVPAAKISEQVDFVTAKATGKKSVNEASGVALTFNHQLAQIEVKAKTTNGSYNLKVYGVRIANPVAKGNFSQDASAAWTLGTDKAVYTVKYAEPLTIGAEAKSIMGGKGSAMLLPQKLTGWNVESDKNNTNKGAYIAVLVNVTTTSGAPVYPVKAAEEGKTTYGWVAVPVNTVWEAGKKYTYTLDFTNGYGYVAPTEPGAGGEGGEGGGDEGDENLPDPTDPDTPNPGDNTTGSPIMFTVTVSPWTNNDMPTTM